MRLHLTRDGVHALLAVPHPITRLGVRDRAMLHLLRGRSARARGEGPDHGQRAVLTVSDRQSPGIEDPLNALDDVAAAAEEDLEEVEMGPGTTPVNVAEAHPRGSAHSMVDTENFK